MKQLISTTKKDSTLVVSWIEDNKHMLLPSLKLAVKLLLNLLCACANNIKKGIRFRVCFNLLKFNMELF